MPRRGPVHQPHPHVKPPKRAKTAARGYDAKWRRLRHRYITANPLCCMCEAEGRIVLGGEVDHKVPISKAPERRLDWSNLQTLCRSHHTEKTAAETRGAT